MQLVRVRSFFIVSLVAALTTACGQGNAALTPTGPSGSLGSAALTSDVSVALDASQTSATGALAAPQRKADKGKGGGKPPESGQEEGSSSEGSELGKPEKPGKPVKGTRGVLSGFVTAITPVSLTINGVVVGVVPETLIRHGHRVLTLADVAVGDHAQARGTFEDVLSANEITEGVLVANAIAEGVLVASEIKVEKTGRSEEGGTVEVEGAVVVLVTEPPGICPAITFTVGTFPDPVITVTTTELTAFSEGLTCLTLPDGTEVKVEGPLQPDGSIVATRISIVVPDIPVEPVP